jgi:hypothetical protein
VPTAQYAISCEDRDYALLGNKRSEGNTFDGCFTQGITGINLHNIHSSLFVNGLSDLGEVALASRLSSFVKFDNYFFYGTNTTIKLNPVSNSSNLTSISFSGCQITTSLGTTVNTVDIHENRTYTYFTNCSFSSGTESIFKFRRFGGTTGNNPVNLSLNQCSLVGDAIAYKDTHTFVSIFENNCEVNTPVIVNNSNGSITRNTKDMISMSKSSFVKWDTTGDRSTVMYNDNGVTVLRSVHDLNAGYELGISYGIGGVKKRRYMFGTYEDWEDVASPQKANGIPTTGTYAVGDLIYNSSPKAGGFIGWVCITAGTPGTWKGFGAISA